MPRDDDNPEARIHAHALGRLSAQESADLAAQARSSPQLNAELVLAGAMVRARAEDPARGLSMAFGWARLSRAIDAETAAQQRAGRWPTHFSRWQTAAAVLVAVAVWQFAAVPQMSGQADDAGYGMAGAPATRAFVAQVVFRPQATELQIRQALLAVDATFVSGPSALGLYELAFADADTLQAGVARLRAQDAVVEAIQVDAPATPAPEPSAGRTSPH
jgi:hypothetical protein